MNWLKVNGKLLHSFMMFSRFVTSCDYVTLPCSFHVPSLHPQRFYNILFTCNSSSCNSDPHHGPYQPWVYNQQPRQSVCPTIHVVLNVAKKTLNHYYTKTDQSEVYHIAMSESYPPFYWIQSSNHVVKFCTPIINSPTSRTTHWGHGPIYSRNILRINQR